MVYSTKPADRPDWRKRAACRDQALEMVPTDDTDTWGLEIQLAKKVCVDCKVGSHCLAAAERLTLTRGGEYAQGVWAGLTEQERATMAGLDLDPRPCPRCGLDCVPINLSTNECNICVPGAVLLYDDYRTRIVSLIEAGLSYRQIAEKLRLNRDAVGDACRRWDCRSKSASARRARPLKECGTLAAKERHRKAGVLKPDCACQNVPWKRGRSRATPKRE